MPVAHRRSLRSKLLLPLALLAFVLTAVAIWGIRANSRRQFTLELEQRGDRVAHFVNSSAEIVSRPVELRRVVTALAAEDDILEIVVAGGQPARVLASTNAAWLGRPLAELRVRDVADDLSTAIRARRASGYFNAASHRFHYSAPLRLNLADDAKGDGAITVHVATRPMEAAIARETWQLSAAVLAGLAVFGGLGYWLLNIRVLRPLAALDRAALNHRETQAAVWRAADTTDEIGALARTLRDSFRQMDAVLRELENQKFALDQHAIVAVTDAAGRFTSVNDKFCELSGYSRGELLGNSQDLVKSGVHSPEFSARLRAALAEGRVWHDEFCSRAKNGTLYWTDCTRVPLLGADGRSGMTISIQTDITERRRAERELSEREQLLSSINTNLSGVSIYRIVDLPDGRVECAYVSPNVVELVGLPAECIVADAMQFFALILPEDLPEFREHRARLSATGETADVTVRIRTVRGDVRWLQFRSRLVERRADGGQVRDGVVSDLTAVKVAEQELRGVRQRLERALRASRTCTWENDVAAGITILDGGWAEMIGLAPAETRATARELLAGAHPDDRASLFAELRRTILGGGDDYHVEHRAMTAAGGWIWVSAQGRVVERDENGRARRIVGTSTDVTARRRAEDELRELNANLEHLVLERTAEVKASERLFRDLVETINHGYFVADHRGLFRYCNPAILAVYGTGADKLPGTSTFRLIVEEDRPRVVSSYRRWVSEGIQQATIDFRMKTGSGAVIWVEQSTAIIRGADGAVTEFRNSVRDVSERKAAEALLRQSDERFRAVFERSPLVIGLLTVPEGRFVEINEAGVAAFGYTREEGLGRTSTELGLWADPAQRDRYLAELKSKGYVTGFEARMRRKNGEVFTVLYSGSLIQISGQTFSLNSLQDISAQRASEQRLTHALDATSDGVWDWNVTTGEVYLSPQWQRLLGFEPGEVAAREDSFFPLVHPDDLDGVRAAIKDHMEGRSVVKENEVRIRTKTGDYRWFLDRGKIVTRDAAGAPLRMVGTITDITERKRLAAEQAQLQERVFQNQKYEALGTLAGGVAHDFNNILMAVINFTVLAKDECPPSHPQIRGFLGEALKGSERAKQLVKQILLVSRSQDAEREPHSVQRVVQEALSLLRSTLPAAIRIDTDLDDEAPAVMANATQIHQVMMNLGINAGHAMRARGGVLTVRLSRRWLDRAEVAALPELKPGLHVSLEVTDTGTGMDAAVIPRIFEPFFTTKGVGEGSGLGLAVVRSVVRGHGGAIAVRSQVDRGTTFEVLLPAGTAAAPVETRVLARPPVLGRGQRILLVDDEPMVGRSMRLMLERLGYVVASSLHPDGALDLFRASPDTFDAVITDFQMPGMNGVELMRRIRQSRPEIPVFMTSGFAGKMTPEMMREAGVTDFLPKPVEMALLTDLLARALAVPEPTTN